MKRLLPYLACIVALPASAGPACNASSSMFELTSCQQAEYVRDSKQLEIAYHAALNSVRSDANYAPKQRKEIVDSLIGSQKFWVKFRDQYCHAVNTKWEQGTIAGLRYWGCMAELTEYQTKQLSSFED